MKKKYIQPQFDVIQLKMTSHVLMSSPDNIPFSQNPEDLIEDPEEIH